MNWARLKSLKCPKCNRDISGSLLENTYRCDGREEGACDFLISEEKFNQVVNNLYKPKSYKIPDDNMSALNNLGRRPYSEDYSDEIERL